MRENGQLMINWDKICHVSREYSEYKELINLQKEVAYGLQVLQWWLLQLRWRVRKADDGITADHEFYRNTS